MGVSLWRIDYKDTGIKLNRELAEFLEEYFNEERCVYSLCLIDLTEKYNRDKHNLSEQTREQITDLINYLKRISEYEDEFFDFSYG